MEIKTTDRESITVVSVRGSVDAMTADDFLKAMQAQLAQDKNHLVADLGGVDYASSAGLRAILAALKETRQNGGDFRLADVQPNVLKVLDLSGFTSILKIYPNVDLAIGSFTTER